VYNSVNIVLSDTTPAKSPISGATVSVYSFDGAQLLAQEQSGVDGVAAFLLASGEYQVRIFKAQSTFQNPRYITVEDDVDNTFDFGGTVFVQPVSPDPRFCLAAGFFIRGNGVPARDLVMHFVPQYRAAILDGRGVVGERVELRFDRNGYGEVSLVRCAKYDVMVVGMDDRTLSVVVPDAPSINLPDLLMPIVQSVVLEPAAPFTVAVGDTVDVVPSVFASDGQHLHGTASEDVQWSTSDPSIAAVSVTDTKLTVLGRKPGTTVLLAERRNVSVPKIPAVPIVGSGAVITVV